MIVTDIGEIIMSNRNLKDFGVLQSIPASGTGGITRNQVSKITSIASTYLISQVYLDVPLPHIST